MSPKSKLSTSIFRYFTIFFPVVHNRRAKHLTKMKQIIFFIFLLTFGLKAKADYRYMNLSTLVCEADYAAVGTIVKLDKSYFYLNVEHYFLSKLEIDTLKIQKFTNWNCGMRHEEYQVGQRELVFFRKSNYVIEDYDLLGYGGGGEFELPIKGDSIFYNYSYGKLKSYELKTFLNALKDFNTLKENNKESAKPISKDEQNTFASKSEFHKLFIECKKSNYQTELDISKIGYIGNLEKNHLYQDYENKIYIYGFDIDSIYLSVEDAEVWKAQNYFIVKPKDAWSRRWLNVHPTNDVKKSKVLYKQIFEILELPEPRIYFGNWYKGEINGYYEAIPTVAHYLDNMHKDEYLEYELLSYTYTIQSDNTVEKYDVKSSRGNAELQERIRKLKPGDKITVSDIYVLYPNKTVKQINGRTVIVGKYE